MRRPGQPRHGFFHRVRPDQVAGTGHGKCVIDAKWILPQRHQLAALAGKSGPEMDLVIGQMVPLLPLPFLLVELAAGICGVLGLLVPGKKDVPPLRAGL
jgi:hypothetical protein